MDKITHARCLELYRKGLTDKAIGEVLFYSKSFIGAWRKRNGLPLISGRRTLTMSRTEFLMAPAQQLEALIEELEASPSPQASIEAARLRRKLEGIERAVV